MHRHLKTAALVLLLARRPGACRRRRGRPGARPRRPSPPSPTTSTPSTTALRAWDARKAGVLRVLRQVLWASATIRAGIPPEPRPTALGGRHGTLAAGWQRFGLAPLRQQVFSWAGRALFRSDSWALVRGSGSQVPASFARPAGCSARRASLRTGSDRSPARSEAFGADGHLPLPRRFQAGIMAQNLNRRRRLLAAVGSRSTCGSGSLTSRCG